MADLNDETFSYEGPQCPYCGYQVTADEPIFYDEMRYTEDECQDCGKEFEVTVCTSTMWACIVKEPTP